MKSNRRIDRKEKVLLSIYHRLLDVYGPQGWWPARTPFEVMVGAILVQNTNWTNVEKVIADLRRRRLLSLPSLDRLPGRELSALIKPAGYFNIKAKRLKSFLTFFKQKYGGSIVRMKARPLAGLREELLDVYGVGPETADSILLYALGKPVFVVDTYTRRLLLRHGFPEGNGTYDEVQGLFMRHLPCKVHIYKEYHALIVRLGKSFKSPADAQRPDYPLNDIKFFIA